MARPIWTGSISFGLVNIPVKLFSAVKRKNVRFNQIESETGARIKQKRVSATTGEEVDYDNIVKGFELPSGEYVIITEDELSALDPDAVKTIDLWSSSISSRSIRCSTTLRITSPRVPTRRSRTNSSCRRWRNRARSASRVS